MNTLTIRNLLLVGLLLVLGQDAWAVHDAQKFAEYQARLEQRRAAAMEMRRNRRQNQPVFQNAAVPNAPAQPKYPRPALSGSPQPALQGYVPRPALQGYVPQPALRGYVPRPSIYGYGYVPQPALRGYVPAPALRGYTPVPALRGYTPRPALRGAPRPALQAR